jgi:hypothetical protein
MAFDQATRNRLQRIVNDARRVLEEEFTRQLQNDYGMDPNSGSVSELASLRHINDAQRESARILRDTLAHYRAGGDMDAKEGLDRIVREQAFTVLNRLAALRMAEARGLLVESVGNGFQAKGFQLYARLAGTGLGETGDAYRTYLFSVFDELSQDLPGLFDRYSPQGRLFPREAALLQVLNLINDAEIAPLWSEDETIGWIYQYFNSKEERKAMRDASQAPRTSRELAVRNQFFTPRYVVEFLVDNTLGRLWFNVTGGATGLRERCHYLLVKPDEAPQAATKLRDPRTFKLLDPACGSMHFGLYAFDLFAEIYREAWAWELRHGPGSLDVSTQPQAALKALSQTYKDEAEFLRDVPRLIIEHNIYGVDIDPRAVQIASLALWLRAQRAWHDAGVKANVRPLMGRGHVVAAVAPPAERELRQQFAANLDQRDAELFERTLQLLNGLPELGVLLRVERELPNLIRQVYVGKGTGLFAAQEQRSWLQAEARLRMALAEFAQAAQSTYQGRLFAQDALQGLRLIDICGEMFDVVVMNPPFGLPTKERFQQLKDSYQDAYVDLYACFVSRAIELCNGWVGAISSRSFLITKKLERLRANWVVPRLERLLDLGWPVMDDATVQSAAYTLNCTKSGPKSNIIAIDRKPYPNKSEQLASIIAHSESASDCFVIDRTVIARIPRAKILYNLPLSAMHLFLEADHIGGEVLLAKQGMKTFNDFRFLRLRSEVAPLTIGRGLLWVPIAKGGAYANFYSDLPLLVNWAADGAQISEVNRRANGQTAQARQASIHYYKPGGTYSYRSKDFGVRALPAGFIISGKGIAVLPLKDYSAEFCVGIMNARLFRTIINLQANAKQYDSGIVESCPFVPLSKQSRDVVERATKIAIDAARDISRRTEGDALFVCPDIRDSLSEMVRRAESHANDVNVTIRASLAEIDRHVDTAYQVDSLALERVLLSEKDDDDGEVDSAEDKEEETEDDGEQPSPIRTPADVASALVSYAVGCALGRWDIRYATGAVPVPELGDPFAELPASFPGMLHEENGGDNVGGYPLILPKSGILVDDEGHQSDLVERSQVVIRHLWRDTAEEVEEQIVSALATGSLREYLRRPAAYFEKHLGLYTKSKRKAPVYWPLSTTSGSYTLWVYYRSLTSQTLYTAINDVVEPKLKQVGGDVTALRNKGSARSRDDEEQFEALQAFELELIELRDTLLKLAPTYQPNHDDGVQISAAPLWPLFRHKPWQKVLKDTWAKLEKGDYDWAHLAMNYWPERVREKCKTDRSLAIAHGLEAVYIAPEAKPKKARGKKKAGGDE